MNAEMKASIVVVIIIAVVVFLVVGPRGCERMGQSWASSAYGADWLVVQYTNTGVPMNIWELKNESQLFH